MPLLLADMRSTIGGDATAMLEGCADEIVARFGGTERGMGGERDVLEGGQNVVWRQGLNSKDVEAGVADVAAAQRLGSSPPRRRARRAPYSRG